jgi:hypothetical protein
LRLLTSGISIAKGRGITESPQPVNVHWSQIALVISVFVGYDPFEIGPVAFIVFPETIEGRFACRCFLLDPRCLSLFTVGRLISVNPHRSNVCRSGMGHIILELPSGLLFNGPAFLAVPDGGDLLRFSCCRGYSLCETNPRVRRLDPDVSWHECSPWGKNIGVQIAVTSRSREPISPTRSPTRNRDV